MNPIFKKLFVFWIACLMSFNGYGQAQPAYNNVQYATGGILQYRGQAMGYAANDPRMHSTLYSVGKNISAVVAGSVVAKAGVGLLFVATTPTIMTAIAGAAIFGIVGTAFSLGTDALVKWIFGEGTTPIITVMPSPSNLTFPWQDLSLLSNPFYKNGTATQYYTTYENVTYTSPYQVKNTSTNASIGATLNWCAGGDVLSVGTCAFGGQPFRMNGAQKIYLWFGAVRPVAASNGTLFYHLDLFDKSTSPATQYGSLVFPQSGYDISPSPLSDGIVLYCPVGTARKPQASACVQYATVNTGSSSVTTPNQTMTQAITALTAAQKAQKASYDTMAYMVNNMWQQAAAKPDYNGIPYVATNPITAAEVQVWANANPSIYPTVADLVAPVTDPNNFAPCTNGSTCAPAIASTPTTTTTTTTNGTTTTSTSTVTGTAQPVTVTNRVSVDLGVDPAIGSPTLEITPTANSILAPILNLFPGFKNYVVPSHTATCPAPTFDAFGKHFVMDGHCALFEQHRSTLYATMMLAFMLVAIFIVLSA